MTSLGVRNYVQGEFENKGITILCHLDVIRFDYLDVTGEESAEQRV